MRLIGDIVAAALMLLVLCGVVVLAPAAVIATIGALAWRAEFRNMIDRE